MGIRDDKMLKTTGTIKKEYLFSLAPAASLTSAVIRVCQVPFSFMIERIQAWCRTVTNSVAATVGFVRPGFQIEAVTLAIATTTTKFQLTSALTAVMPLASQTPGALPTVVNKAVADNIAFTDNFTVNAAVTAVAVWGAARVQMDYLGAITTKVVDDDQAYATEAEALYACPAADADKNNLGTITIQVDASQTFTANTTALDAALLNDVNYNGAAAGLVSAQDSAVTYVSGDLVAADLVNVATNRAVAQAGGLLVVSCTSNGGSSLVDGTLDVGVRVWPVNEEVAPRNG